MYPDNANNGREMYVEGISTRKVKDVTEKLCGTSFSKSLVSSLTARLDSELQAWRSRPLEAEAYPYLLVDARYEKVRVGHKVVSQGVLLVSGARDDGFREILGVEVSDTESEATYQALFCSLKSRGLSGVDLVVSDDHKGLKAAIARHFQGGLLATLPSSLCEEPPRNGGSQEAQRAFRRPARAVRSGEQGSGPQACF
jgi:transposase-like protein